MNCGRGFLGINLDRNLSSLLQDQTPAREPIPASYSAPGVLAEAAHKSGRAKADFELREISKQEYERIKSLLL